VHGLQSPATLCAHRVNAVPSPRPPLVIILNLLEDGAAAWHLHSALKSLLWGPCLLLGVVFLSTVNMLYAMELLREREANPVPGVSNCYEFYIIVIYFGL